MANTINPANTVLFEELCVVLEQLTSIKKQKKVQTLKQEQTALLEKFIDNIKVKIASFQGSQESSLFPILRLILPDHDRNRSAYNLKETKLSNLLVKVLSLNKKSYVAQKLLTHRSVNNSIHSDLPGVAYFALKNVLPNSHGTLNVGQVNEILDKIATAEVGNKSSVLDDVFSYALKNLTLQQLKWFLRIVLKDMKIRMGVNHVLATFHPDAPDFYKNCNNLYKVCQEFEEGQTRPIELGVKVFSAVSPMLSEKLNVTHVEQQLSFNSKKYCVEKKFDGERFQIHMQNNVFEYFSRKGHAYSDHYGKTYDSGILTPYLRNCFNSEVKSFILDGEMMGWHKVNEHFGCKGMAFDVKKITENSKFRPCFCAFDILYYNGKSLVGVPNKGGVPLKDRLKVLDSMFTNVAGVIQLSTRENIKNSTQILDKLNQAIENQEEGIVVKDIDSFYSPSQRNAGWYKIKPEYTDSTMTDLDLVVIGADEAENKKQGRARCFYVACVDEENAGNTVTGKRWLCVARVVTGLSFEERESLCLELEKHWVRSKNEPFPPYLVFNKEKPDFWILPERSVALQVRATELIRSVSYGTSYTLRFPRVTRVRKDKPVADVMTLQQFEALLPSNDPVIKLSTKQVNPDSMVVTDTKIRKKRHMKVATVPKQFRVTMSDAVEATSKALLGRKICILTEDPDCKKPELRKIVESHSGVYVSNVGPDTWCAIVGQISRRENEIIKSQEVNIADTSWLRNLAPSEEPYKINPLDMVALKKATRLQLSREYDIHGDSYTLPVNEDSLKKCLNKMNKSGYNIHLTTQEMLRIDEELFGDTNPFSFLRPCRIHVSNNSSIHAIQARMYGAEICDLFTPNLTHVVICKTTNSKDVKKLKNIINAFVISEDWLEACFKHKSLIDVTDFLLL